ncbi:MAG: hypothetical protein QOD55_360 [Solirubrobacteraceae bacterium]|jgi:hypothetical protein|nr:hypothetical protein [Solirubrobacteraceae bacterium]
MTHPTNRLSHPGGLPRRRRTARTLDLFAAIPDDRSAAAMDDAAEAERLIEDLLALVDAGLVAPVEDHGEIRYAPAAPGDITA